ncbi:hypothetical protein DNTS_015404 [Danionella cerebrum]|uniref:Proline-rich transmembrane protein 3/4 domain-containing protein n=1 Tax=Danionella cerebrum TaxID=2873325 RepID=A0A553R3R4_9TELE|nr:hypothetical protein DNTS_015404 [Danionella translucida]
MGGERGGGGREGARSGAVSQGELREEEEPLLKTKERHRLELLTGHGSLSRFTGGGGGAGSSAAGQEPLRSGSDEMLQGPESDRWPRASASSAAPGSPSFCRFVSRVPSDGTAELKENGIYDHLTELFLLLHLLEAGSCQLDTNLSSPFTSQSKPNQSYSDAKPEDRIPATAAALDASRASHASSFQNNTSSRASNRWTETHTNDTSSRIPHADIGGSNGSTQTASPQRVREKKTEETKEAAADLFNSSAIGTKDETSSTRISSVETLTDITKDTKYNPQGQTAHSLTTEHKNTTMKPSSPTSASAPPEATSMKTSKLEPGQLGTAPTTKIQPREFTTIESMSQSTTRPQLEEPFPELDIDGVNHSTRSSQLTRSRKIGSEEMNEPSTEGPAVDEKNRGKPTVHKTLSAQPTGQVYYVFSENDGRPVEKEKVPPLKSNSDSTSHPRLKKLPCDILVGSCVLTTREDQAEQPDTINGTFLVWGDLKRTLSFAWETHVFGSAALFLMLTAGSILGLVLAPSLDCPHRGEIILSNSFLLAAGVCRAGHFLLDPYGASVFLPPPVVIASYTLALPLLILAQAALVILVLKEAGVPWLPASPPHPPLLGMLAVLQCTLLLAADLLSPALSPAVPIVLQSLTLTVGLGLCLGYLSLVLPWLPHARAARGGNIRVANGKVLILARVLAACAFLGALCCLLHVYACLWLYGVLGDWRRFRWGWWLCQFWARLLELAWAFGLLLVSSWVFWRPNGSHICGAPRLDRVGVESLPSPVQSSNAGRHTCWAKIVQSLKVRQLKKSESNGIAGSNSGTAAGELPNNWPGQERSGADISKSLIRNRDPLKDSNLKGFTGGSASSLQRLQGLSQMPQSSLSSCLDREKESTISLCDFDLRPPTPIDLTRSIDEALNRGHLLRGESLFQPLRPPSPPSSPNSWMRRNSDPQITLSLSSDEHTLLTESSVGLDRSIPSAVPSRQVTAPPTPTHQGFRWVSEAPVPSSVSCPVSLHPSPTTSQVLLPSGDNTRPFVTPDFENSLSTSKGGRSYLKVTQTDDTASVSSDIVDL